jgi:hypothetical protein
MNKLPEFLVAIAPALMRFAGTLFDAYQDDAEGAIREIQDRTDDIKRRRAAIDQALADKYKDTPEG